MKENEIRKYAKLMKELELNGLEITEGSMKVRLERSAAVPVPVIEKNVMVNAPQAASEAAVQKTEASDYISVRSPIVGVFYAAPAENASPYVSIGDRVSKGQTLCIVEAMKLMNDIVAEEDGEIAEICAANGQVVEYGTELFRLKK